MTALAPPRIPLLNRSGPGGPGALDGERGSGGRGWVALTDASNDIEAALIMGRLDEEGVECTSLKDRARTPSWAFCGSNPWAPVTIMVRRTQLDEARIVLAEVAFEAPAVDPSPPQTSGSWRGPVAWWVVAIVLAVAFTAVGYLRIAETAERCGLGVVCTGDER